MRKIVLMTSIVLLFITGCTIKDEIINEYQSKGIIQGPDEAMCACCGGWIIKLEESQEDYRIDKLPEGSNIDLETASFPLSIEMNWELDRNCNGIKYITIDELKIIE